MCTKHYGIKWTSPSYWSNNEMQRVFLVLQKRTQSDRLTSLSFTHK